MAPTLASLSITPGAPVSPRTKPQKIEIPPAADMGGKHHALGRKVHGSAEADPAGFESGDPGATRPIISRICPSHPLAAARGSVARDSRRTMCVAVEAGHGELGAADIDGQDHRTACQTMATGRIGEAVAPRNFSGSATKRNSSTPGGGQLVEVQALDDVDAALDQQVDVHGHGRVGDALEGDGVGAGGENAAAR